MSDLTKTAELVHDEIAATVKFNICPATNAHIERILVSFNAYTSAVREELEQQASDQSGDL
jgi:hypothetical protein